MSDGISRADSIASFDPSKFASGGDDDACHAPAALPHSTEALALQTTPYLPVDHPGSGVTLHKFPATGEVSWACLNDCVSSQGLTGAGAGLATGVLAVVKNGVAATAALITEVTVTPIACYVACSDLEGLPPAPQQPEPQE